MTPNETTYSASPRQIEDMKTAYAALQRMEDINSKFRAAGEPDAEREAKAIELRERLTRFATAFEIPLE